MIKKEWWVLGNGDAIPEEQAIYQPIGLLSYLDSKIEPDELKGFVFDGTNYITANDIEVLGFFPFELTNAQLIALHKAYTGNYTRRERMAMKLRKMKRRIVDAIRGHHD